MSEVALGVIASAVVSLLITAVAFCIHHITTEINTEVEIHTLKERVNELETSRATCAP